MTIQRVAMWSGPRNISTAMMRAWENRSDTVVHDEPLYAHYLQQTGIEHPSADEIIAAYDTSWRGVITTLLGPIEADKQIYYQKHMTHHMLPHIERAWILSLSNCFLIRDPRRVIVSLAKVLHSPSIEQTGFPQQIELFRFVQAETGSPPPVLDAKDVLQNPRATLSKLCERLGVSFDDAMLSWPAGPRASDGLWAKHWYDRVEQSTEFMPYQASDTPVPVHLQAIADECQAYYEELAAHSL